MHSLAVCILFYQKGENATCVFYDPVQNGVSTDGCITVNTSNGFTECHCDHLTNFALLMVSCVR